MGSCKIINTSIISSNINNLENHQKYFAGKKTTFSQNAYGNSTELTNYLAKTREIYDAIAQNIASVKNYLNDYVADVEGLENEMAGGAGIVSNPDVTSIIARSKNSIKNYVIDSDNLFEVSNLNENSSEYNYDNVNIVSKEAATVAICGLSFLEGVINIGEMLVDGGAMLVAGACSVLGLDKQANTIGNFVKEDWTKDLYHSITSSTKLDRYADPDGTAANICSMAGNIVGMVGLSILTGGAAAGAFGAGTAAASTVTTAANAVIGSLSNIGSEGQLALERGATVNEAENVALIAGATGLAQGAISGRIDAAARAVGAGVGKAGMSTICEYALAAFGVGAAEPLINEMAQTVIYRNDEKTGFFDSFLANSAEDGLLFQMALAGGMNSFGTVGNALGGIRHYNDLSKQIESAMNESTVSEIELKDISEISSDLMNKITDPSKVVFKIGEESFRYTDGAFMNAARYNDLSEQVKSAMAGADITEIKLNSISEIPSDLLGKITDSDKVIFKVGEESFRYTDGTFIKVARYNDLSEQIKLAMDGTKFTEIKINDVSEIPSDLLSKITDSDKVVFTTGEEIFTYTNGTLNKIDESTMNVMRYNLLSKQIDTAMNQVKLTEIQVDDITEISSDLLSRITDPSKVIFKAGEDIYRYVNESMVKIDDPMLKKVLELKKSRLYEAFANNTLYNIGLFLDDSIDIEELLNLAQDSDFRLAFYNTLNPSDFDFALYLKYNFERSRIKSKIIRSKVDVGAKNYNFLFNDITSGEMTLDELDYLCSFPQYAPSSSKIPMNLLTGTKQFVKGEMVDTFIDQFGDYIEGGEETIRQKLQNTILFSTDEVYTRIHDSDSMGLNDGTITCINLKYADSPGSQRMIETNINHESIHQISSNHYFKLEDSYVSFVKTLGVALPDNPNTTVDISGINTWIGDSEGNGQELFRGLNETLTEYFSKVTTGIYDNSCGYNDAVKELMLLLNEDEMQGQVLDLASLKKAYFSHDVRIITNRIQDFRIQNEKTLLEPSFFGKLFKAFDGAIDRDYTVRESALSDLNALIMQICLD